MGSYTFKWEHPAEEVYVTGTFDDWTKSVKLDKEGDIFQKTVDLKDASKKIYYKFVVDNNWTTNETAPKEPDQDGNVNNFLTPDQIAAPSVAAAIINTVTPQSTTAKMAGEQPKIDRNQTATPSDVPGGFPATPAEDLDKPVGINPLPAAAGGVNPVKLEPGQKVPEVTASDINQNVKLDKASYEQADTLPGVATQPSINAKPIIPESGLPAHDNTINSVGAASTTAALAGQVPKESKNAKRNKKSKANKKKKAAAAKGVTPEDTETGTEADEADETKVPEPVKESQVKAGVSPEASADPEEVREKAEVENELKSKVPEAGVTSSGTAGVGTEKTEKTAGAVAAVTAAGGAAAGAAIAAKNTAVDKAGPTVNQAATAAADAADKNLPESVKEKLPIAAQQAISSHAQEEVRQEVSPQVPAEVKQSITEAHEKPEAAANTAAVQEKKLVEAELQKEVKPAPAISQAKGSEIKSEAKSEKPITDAYKAAEPLKPQAEKSAEKPIAAAPITSAAPITAAAVGTGSKFTESKPVETKPVETKPVISKPVETKPIETKPVESKPSTTATTTGTATGAATGATTGATTGTETKAAANGSGSKNSANGSESKTVDAATADKKKKSRLSTILSKIKGKVAGK